METQIREALARGYCSPENEKKVVDPDLIEAMTKEILKSFSPAKPNLHLLFARTNQRNNNMNPINTGIIRQGKEINLTK
ncbi:MAG: hypothetical protein ABFD76_15450 [Smithella sp.]